MILYPSVWTLITTCTAATILKLATRDQAPLHDDKGEGDALLFPAYIRNNLGQYAPWFPVEAYVPGPEGCYVTQVNLLYRHGARGPTSGLALRLQETLAKLKNATSYSPEMEFLRKYTYALGKENLLPFGAEEAKSAGRSVYSRYPSLLRAKEAPFVRASHSARVIDTATNWTSGLIAASEESISIPFPLTIPEDVKSNNTLENHNCPATTNKYAEDATKAYLSVFAPPITTRINSGVPNANLADEDVVNIFFFCAFDSLVKEVLSPFCGLFTIEEYTALEYYQDLGKYYLTGYGNPLGPVQGVGYVNELIARLTSTPVPSVTNINRTLDASPETFPLNRFIYADFSHDNQLLPIYAALGLHLPPQDLPSDRAVPPEEAVWVASKLVPFGARLVVERYTCQPEFADVANGKEAREWARILNNDRVLDVPACETRGPGRLCELGAFVRGLQYARSGAIEDWARCHAQNLKPIP